MYVTSIREVVQKVFLLVFALVYCGFFFVDYILQISFLVHNTDHNKKGKRAFIVYIK